MAQAEAPASELALRGPVQAFVGLGANLGDAADTLRWAMAAMAQLPQTQLVARSGLYQSQALDCEPGAPPFVNAVVALRTGLSAPELLAALQQLEQAAGRQRPYRHAPRTLDLDLLLFGEGKIESDSLCVPHPRMRQRAFVLRPLAEIAPQWAEAAAAPDLASQVVCRMDDPQSGLT
jgi:2-amino-4-hydroxy-6-hydroxymethyldihydropteridine diphosphokinase